MKTYRVLVIDDDPSLHEDLRLYLCPRPPDENFERETRLLFGEAFARAHLPQFEIAGAFQGRAGLELVKKALEEGRPFSVAFVDMRMPPGWDGLETIERLWEVDPMLQLVLCTAYSDHTWEELQSRLSYPENLLILRKPYDQAEVRQMACALSSKRNLRTLAELKMDDLTRMVVERTRELDEARRSAEKAHRVKANFLATMSHEMRTPLNGILGLVELMAGAGPSEEVREQLKLMALSGQTLMELIDEVLDHAKIEAGQVVLERAPFPLRSTLQDLVKTHAVLAEQSGLELRAEVSAAPEWAVGDGGKLKRVLNNLLSNALRYTERGSVILSVRRRGSLLVFEVEDTGVGIAPEEMDIVFEPYRQAKRLAHSSAGTGLGLSISRHLVEVMGGDLTVESQLDRGSLFYFELDLPTAEPPTPAKAVPVELDLQGRVVLVVEDEPVSQKVARKLLNRLGASVLAAKHGLEALELLKESRVDLVLLDLRMPVMDGHETIRRIRASNQAWASVPVVAVTAEVGEDERRRCLDMGMDGYVKKPIRMEALSRAIDQAINARAR